MNRPRTPLRRASERWLEHQCLTDELLTRHEGWGLVPELQPIETALCVTLRRGLALERAWQRRARAHFGAAYADTEGAA